MRLGGTAALLLLLLVAALVAFLPAVPVQGAVGHPTLGVVNQVPTPTSFTPAMNNLSLPAGSMQVTAVDGVGVTPSTDLLAINFTGITFSGGQFYLLMSQNGLASQSASDVQYSPTFEVADFAANKGTLEAVTNVNGTFYIGEFGSTPVVVGPIAVFVSSAYKYIKVYDGNSGAEAASTQQLIIAAPATATVSATSTLTTTTTSTTSRTTTATLTSESRVTQTATSTLTEAATTIVEPVTYTTVQAVTSTRVETSVVTSTIEQPTTFTSVTVVTTTAKGAGDQDDAAYLVLAAAVVIGAALVALALTRRKA